MKKTITLFLFNWMVSLCTGQNVKVVTVNVVVDSLKKELLYVEFDSLRARLMVEISETYVLSNIDSSEYYAMEALAIANEFDFVQEQLGAMGFLGQGFINKGNLPKALELGLKAMEIGQQSTNVIAGIGPNYDNLGWIYFLIGDYKKSNEYFLKELALGGEDLMAPAYGYWNIANILLQNDKLDSALIYLDKSFAAFEKINYSYYPNIYHVYPHWYNTRAKIYIRQNRKEEAIKDLHQSLLMTISYGEGVLSAETCNDIARLYSFDNQADSSLHYAHQALSYAQSINFTKGIYESANLLANLYESIDDSKALYFHKLAVENQNKLYGAGNMQTIRDMIQQDEKRKQELAASELAFENRIRQYLLISGLLFSLLFAFTLFRSFRKTKRSNAVLNKQKQQIEETLNQLKSTQSQLIQSEKMASLGELTAGIAHEIQNPLNFVNNFSEVSTELIDEAREEMEAGETEEVHAILDDLKGNLVKISHHGKRASGIVRSMLDHSRTSSDEKVETDINALCDEYLRLAYHGMRARDRSFNADFEINLDPNLPKIKVIAQDIGRVLLNLINNAFQATQEMTSLQAMSSMKPKVIVTTRRADSPLGHLRSKASLSDEATAKSEATERAGGKGSNARTDSPLGHLRSKASLSDEASAKSEATERAGGKGVLISISDNGPGIPDDIKDKIFQPFFTTKPTGQGTGLGLSLAYDIVKAHGGKIRVEGKAGFGTTFIIQLPLHST